VTAPLNWIQPERKAFMKSLQLTPTKAWPTAELSAGEHDVKCMAAAHLSPASSVTPISKGVGAYEVIHPRMRPSMLDAVKVLSNEVTQVLSLVLHQLGGRPAEPAVSARAVIK